MSRNKRVSIKGVAQRAIREDKKARDAASAAVSTEAMVKGTPSLDAVSTTADSFVNFAQKMGIGADNPLSSAGYGFNPISRIRNTLEWIHRGSWLGGVAVDVVADDMTRMGVELTGQLKPEQISDLEEMAVELGIWNSINETIKWARLYGGCLAVMMIDGQDMSTPLRIETIGPDQFKGLLVLDRWMVEPSLENLVTTSGPDLGLPKFYRITADAPALPRLTVHHSRCIRLEGIRLPYWQRVQENLWGISVLERLYDRMIAYDSASTGAAQLTYKSYIRTYKVKGMREIIAAGGPAVDGLVKYVDMMRRFQSIEGITLLDGEDEFESQGHSAFSGLGDVLGQFGQQLSGALQIPLVRLFGQSPSGFNSGDVDLRMYYDSIKQQQNMKLKVGVTKVYRAMAQSKRIKLPNGFGLTFRSLWQLNDKEKAEIANSTVDAVTKAKDSGLLSDKTAMSELRQSSQTTGIFTNITDEDIEKASEDLAPPADELLADDPDDDLPGMENKPPRPGEKAKDAVGYGIGSVTAMKALHDLDVVIENPRGTIRRGGVGLNTWQVVLPADYGYIRKTMGADGDQVDCYVGDCPTADMVYVINQIDPDTGAFDEHKCLLGFADAMSAIRTYLAGFTDGRGPDRLSSIEFMPMQDFKTWLRDPATNFNLPCTGVRREITSQT